MNSFHTSIQRFGALCFFTSLISACADSPSLVEEGLNTRTLSDETLLPTADDSKTTIKSPVEVPTTSESAPKMMAAQNPIFLAAPNLISGGTFQIQQAQDVDAVTGDLYSAIMCASRADPNVYQRKFCLFKHSAAGELKYIFQGNIGDRTDCTARHVKLTNDGKVLFTAQCGYEERILLIGRFLMNGQLDPNFGAGKGYVIHQLAPSQYWTVSQELAIDSDGKILVGGVFRESPFSYYYSFVSRFNVNGSLDASFGSQGTYVYRGVSDVYYNLGMKLLSDKKILLSAHLGGHQGRLIRLLPQGAIDTSFGNNGVALPSVSMSIDNVLVQSNGKIIVAGAGGQRFYQFIQRFNADGSNDPTFKKMVLVGMGAPYGTNGWWGSVGLQADDKIVYAYRGCRSTKPNRPICGSSGPDEQFYIHSLAVKRFTADGEDDLSFGPNATRNLEIPKGKAQWTINRPAILVTSDKIHVLSHDVTGEFSIR